MSNTLPNVPGGEFSNTTERWTLAQGVGAGILTLTTMFGSTGCDALNEPENDVAVVVGMICKDKAGELTPPAITGMVNRNVKNSAAGGDYTDDTAITCPDGAIAGKLSTNVIPLSDYKKENLQPHQVAVLSKGVLGKNSPLVSFRKTNDNTAVLEINGSGNIIAAEGATKLPGQCK